MRKQFIVTRTSIISIILLGIVCLVGCATTVKDIERNPAGKYEFIVKEEYITVHRKAVRAIEKRNLPGMTTLTRVYSDIKEAKVYNKNTSGFGTIYILCMSKAIDKNKTSVKIYYLTGNRKNKALALKNDILNNDKK